MEVTTKQVPELMKDIIKAKLIPMLHGSPALGKSDIVKQVAEYFNLELIDFRLSQADPVLLMGFPSIPEGADKAGFTPLRNFPLEGDSLPKGKDGWFIFFDEINTAPQSVTAAAYKILLDRMVGDFKLHSNVVMAAAGNLASDKAITNRMSTALQSRLIHLTVIPDDTAWLDWAAQNDIDYRVRSFIKFKPELLHKFNPNHDDHTFPAPRTWDFLSRLIKNWGDIPTSKLPLLMGTVGKGAAIEFKAFTDVMEELPDFQQILSNPEGITIPDDPSTLYAITGLIGHKANTDNIDTLMKLVNRFPKEFQVICLQDIIKHDDALCDSKSIEDWINNNSAAMTQYM